MSAFVTGLLRKKPEPVAVEPPLISALPDCPYGLDPRIAFTDRNPLPIVGEDDLSQLCAKPNGEWTIAETSTMLGMFNHAIVPLKRALLILESDPLASSDDVPGGLLRDAARSATPAFDQATFRSFAPIREKLRRMTVRSYAVLQQIIEDRAKTLGHGTADLTAICERLDSGESLKDGHPYARFAETLNRLAEAKRTLDPPSIMLSSDDAGKPSLIIFQDGDQVRLCRFCEQTGHDWHGQTFKNEEAAIAHAKITHGVQENGWSRGNV